MPQPQSLGITIPSIPSPPNGRAFSPAESTVTSDDSSQLQTPVSPSFADPEPVEPLLPAGSSEKKRKSAHRRANTAERRATHNAVERARRETLNGRFLDLAALLPNLSQIRRPSKSAIVNSSIAHVHASRRHRVLASRELRLLKLEADALRREVNEWRDRAGVPRVKEPVRGDGFSVVLAGELEMHVTAARGGEFDDDDDDDQGDGGEYVYGNAPGSGGRGSPAASEHEGYEFSFPQRPNSFDMAGPMVVVSPGGGMVMENPAMGMMFNNVNNIPNMNIPLFVGGMPPNSSPGGSFLPPQVDQAKWAAAAAVGRARSGSGSSTSYFEPAGWNHHPLPPPMGGGGIPSTNPIGPGPVMTMMM